MSLLLSSLLVATACGGGRSETGQYDGMSSDAPFVGLGGATTARGGATHITTTARGGLSGLGGLPPIASGGRLGSGGSTALGGYLNLGGTSRGGAGLGGAGRGGAGLGGVTFGGATGIGGRAAGGVGLGGKTATAGTSTGGLGGFAGRVDSGGAAGFGIGGSAGASSCNPSRPGTAPGGLGGTMNSPVAPNAGAPVLAGTTGGMPSNAAAGAAGAAAQSPADWYVDAQNGSDSAPGTQAQPLKTLSCAASVARSGETVRLLDGTWDRNVDPKLGSTMTTRCGLDSGIAFAPDVSVRAVHLGAAKIQGSGYHALCMSGGLVEGIQFTCGEGRPAIETTEGTLQISGSSFNDCAPFGFDVGGNATVTLRPDTLPEYLTGTQVGLAYVHGTAALTVIGGTVSFQSRALLVEDSGSLKLQGVKIQSSIAGQTAGPAVTLSNGTPNLTVTDETSFDGPVIAIYGYSSTSTVTIDGMFVTGNGSAIIITEDQSTFVPQISINRLSMTDCAGLGVDVSGNFDLSVSNSTFTRVESPNIMPSGSGSVTLDHLVFDGGWGAIYYAGTTDAPGMKLRARNVVAAGAECTGVYVVAGNNDVLDFGTAEAPGNNSFVGNHLNTDPNFDGSITCANFAFTGPSGFVIQAVGNTWDANQQGADASGHYALPSSGGPLLVSYGLGPNYLALSDNLSSLMLASP